MDDLVRYKNHLKWMVLDMYKDHPNVDNKSHPHLDDLKEERYLP